MPAIPTSLYCSQSQHLMEGGLRGNECFSDILYPGGDMGATNISPSAQKWDST